MFETKSRTVPITQQMVKNAYQKVKSNGGSAGVDGESLAEYQLNNNRDNYHLFIQLIIIGTTTIYLSNNRDNYHLFIQFNFFWSAFLLKAYCSST